MSCCRNTGVVLIWKVIFYIGIDHILYHDAQPAPTAAEVPYQIIHTFPSSCLIRLIERNLKSEMWSASFLSVNNPKNKNEHWMQTVFTFFLKVCLLHLVLNLFLFSIQMIHHFLFCPSAILLNAFSRPLPPLPYHIYITYPSSYSSPKTSRPFTSGLVLAWILLLSPLTSLF